MRASITLHPGALMTAIVWFAAAADVTTATLAFPPGAGALNKKLTSRSYMDARHCLDLPTNAAIIRCAEKYM